MSSLTSDVYQLIEEAGCILVRSGKHQIWYSPITKRNFTVPHTIKSKHTANGILKDAGLKKQF